MQVAALGKGLALVAEDVPDFRVVVEVQDGGAADEAEELQIAQALEDLQRLVVREVQEVLLAQGVQGQQTLGQGHAEPGGVLRLGDDLVRHPLVRAVRNLRMREGHPDDPGQGAPGLIGEP